MFFQMAASTYARARRAFFRLSRLARAILACAVPVLGVSAGYLIIGHAYAQRFPWLSSSAQVYVQWHPSAAVNGHGEVFAWSLAQVTQQPQEELQPVVAWLASQPAVSYALLKQDENVAFLIAEPHELPTVFPEAWTGEVHHIGKRRVMLVHRGQAPRRRPVLLSWWVAWRLDTLLSGHDAVLLAREGAPARRPVYGTLRTEPSGWTVMLSPSPAVLRYPKLEEAMYPQALAGIMTKREVATFLHMLVPGDVLDAASPLWGRLASFPGYFYVLEGSLAAAGDVFSDEFAWMAGLEAESPDANLVLQSILNELMRQFPLAVERVLPDNSKVFELKRSEAFFVSSGAQVDVVTQPQGALTFPHDQIAYRYEGGRLDLFKGVEDREAVAQQRAECGLVDPLATGFLESELLGVTLWKTLFWAVDTEKIVVCVIWPELGVENS